MRSQSLNPMLSPISKSIWESKYRDETDGKVEDTWRRVARALASVEDQPQRWEGRFYDALSEFRFLPGGRILAGAGTSRRVTLLNCFVMGRIEDSIDGIFDALKEGAVTMQEGGGVGYDFSTLRPRGARAQSAGNVASGPVSFMRIWDAMCGTILSTGARRGAMMATLRCDHPDIEEFIDSKATPGTLRNFNLSVLVTDDFMKAVRSDAEWLLVFPSSAPAKDETVLRRWPGFPGPVPCRIHRRLRARRLWSRIMRATYDHGDPGVLFIDRINRLNNLAYREEIGATNPCGEVPLPPYGACDLGSINLTRFVLDPFEQGARLDEEGIRRTSEIATRMLDNVIDATRFPIERQRDYSLGARRIGLGITGLADALVMLGLRYDGDGARQVAARVMALICHAGYRTSIRLAEEKGSFPFFDREPYLQAVFVRALPSDIRDGIERSGIRNSHLTAIAPTGTISLFANNVSSGIEPIFGLRYRRRILGGDGVASEHEVVDYAYDAWRSKHGEEKAVPPIFVSAENVPVESQLDMQAALQPHVDNAISKTIQVPAEYPVEDFQRLYELAYDKGLKGCTTFRPNPITGQVIQIAAQQQHCCTIEREAD
jgi:ribonucleoside-diphosphate reductase alpha chain